MNYFSHNTHNKEAIPSKDIPNKVVTPNKDILLNKVVILLNKEVINIHLSNNNTLLNKEATNILLSNRVAIISKNIKKLLFFRYDLNNFNEIDQDEEQRNQSHK